MVKPVHFTFLKIKFHPEECICSEIVLKFCSYLELVKDGYNCKKMGF